MGMGAGTVDILNAEALLKIEGDQITKEEYEKALEEREKAWRDDPMKAFPLTKEEIEQLKKEGRI